MLVSSPEKKCTQSQWTAVRVEWNEMVQIIVATLSSMYYAGKYVHIHEACIMCLLLSYLHEQNTYQKQQKGGKS